MCVVRHGTRDYRETFEKSKSPRERTFFLDAQLSPRRGLPLLRERGTGRDYYQYMLRYIAHRWRVQVRRCISSTGPVSRNGRPCPFPRVITKRGLCIRDPSRTKGGERAGEKVDGRRGRTFRIIRQALSFSRARSYSSRESDSSAPLLSPSFFSRPLFSRPLPRRCGRNPRKQETSRREYNPMGPSLWALRWENARERCSPCEHARDTDGPSEWRESLNRRQTQSSASAGSGVDAALSCNV